MKKQITFKDVLYMFNVVLDWNKCAGNLPSDRTLTKVYHQLTQAEYSGKGEFLEGFQTHNHEMILDGIGDMTFTGFFWAASEGLEEEALQELYDYAFSCYKFGEATYSGTVNLLAHYLKFNDSWFFVKELLVLMLILQDTYDLIGAFDAVQRSNFSKYPKVSEVAEPEKELQIILDKGRYIDLNYKEFEGRYIFTSMQDLQDDVTFDKPKIIKSTHFREVEDLTQFVY